MNFALGLGAAPLQRALRGPAGMRNPQSTPFTPQFDVPVTQPPAQPTNPLINNPAPMQEPMAGNQGTVPGTEAMQPDQFNPQTGQVPWWFRQQQPLQRQPMQRSQMLARILGQ